MPSTVPTPVAAAVGLVPTVLDGVRRLPGKAVQLPVFALTSALTHLGTARREYDDLAERGERLLARLRGTSFDEVEDRVEDALQGTPLARPYDAVEDALEDAGEAVASAGRAAAARARRTAGTLERKADDAADKAADAAKRVAEDVQQELPETTPEQEQPKGGATPKATQPDDTRVDTAATAEVVETVEQASAASSAPTVLDHDELPLADYDHMTLGSLRGRLRSLSVDQLVQVRDYEKAHADRLPVVTMLDNRIAKLATDSSAAPSGGDPAATSAPERRRPAKTGSKVSPSTSAPAPGADPHGVPGNPHLPR